MGLCRMDAQVKKDLLDFIWSEGLLARGNLVCSPEHPENSYRIVIKKDEFMDIIAEQDGDMLVVVPEKSIMAFSKKTEKTWEPKYYENLSIEDKLAARVHF